MILQPFYRLYECRYMVYWPILSEKELQTHISLLTEKEKRRAALDSITTDKVICGEQQPENDHFIQMEKSRIGDDEGTHWRETNNWFSYRMKTGEESANKVYILFRPEFRRDARIEINGKEVGKLTDRRQLSDVSVAEFDIPEPLRFQNELTVKICKGNEKVTPHIYEIRLICR